MNDKKLQDKLEGLFSGLEPDEELIPEAELSQTKRLPAASPGQAPPLRGAPRRGLAAAPLVLLVAASVAILLPVFRYTRVDPAGSMREE